jgi:lipopolysaccharide/colanic/teichoic acid biosynthesis glycosyltransferase
MRRVHNAEGDLRRSLALGVKRALDLAASAIGLVMLAPLLAGVALTIRLVMRGPALFRQVRPGHGGRPFILVKFRTMRDAAGPDGSPLPDSARLTRLGVFLRKSSLDELPQLWNVLRGDLSLVGPRPLLMEYLARYTSEQARRHDIRPGITGWAQVNGRNAIGWDEKFRLDVWYVDHWSLRLDFTILRMTLAKVVCGSGITHPGATTMPVFGGSEAKDAVGV